VLVDKRASYPGSPRFKSPSGDLLSRQVYRGFPESFLANAGIDFELGHDRFLPNKLISNSSFIYHHFIGRYVVCVAEKASLNKLKINKLV
jgi:hypothetical protein